MPNCVWPHGWQCTRPHCLPLYPRVFSSSCPQSQWLYLTISSSHALFSFCLQSLPASKSFPIIWLLASGGQSNGVSALASVLPMNIQDWSPLGWTGWISLQSKGLSKVFSSTTVQKHQFFIEHSVGYEFSWVCLSPSPLLFTSLFTSAICKISSDNHFTFLHFFFFGILITASCTMLWTSVHSSSGTLSNRSNPLNLFVQDAGYLLGMAFRIFACQEEKE